MISHDRLAQYWEEMGHISYYQRVDLDALMDYTAPTPSGDPAFVGSSGSSAPFVQRLWDPDDVVDDDDD